MPQMRYNLITGEWVILATERGRRPHDFAEPERPGAPAAFDPGCPFCPGNEDQTGPPNLTVPEKGAWRLRVVPNRYPALSSEGEPVRTGAGYEMAINGVGRHEVVIESAAHDANLAGMDAAALAEVIRTSTPSPRRTPPSGYARSDRLPPLERRTPDHGLYSLLISRYIPPRRPGRFSVASPAPGGTTRSRRSLCTASPACRHPLRIR